MKKIKKGFTLIELLIVIALLGVLAVALLAALDPLEQIKKGTDTGLRNTVGEINNAFLQYASSHSGTLPYGTSTIAWGSVGSMATTPAGTVLQAVELSGELKTGFLANSKSSLDKIFVYADPTTGQSYVCFSPQSKMVDADPQTKYTAAAGGSVNVAACTNGTAAGGTVCYWCAR